MHTRGTLEINGTSHVLLHADDMPHELARCFAALDSAEQAAFFSWLRAISHRWPRAACFQWRDMVDAMDPAARAVFADMIDQFQDEDVRDYREREMEQLDQDGQL